MIPRRIGYFNKRVTNPILRRLARSSRGPFAVIYHVGRKSKKPYETTIMVWLLRESFVIALTYGDAVDWYRNILAAESSTLLWHGSVYTVGRPEPIEVETALPAFPLALRPILRRQVRHFVQVKFVEPSVAAEVPIHRVQHTSM